MRFNLKNKIAVKNEDYLNMVGDGAIAESRTADGRLIPVIILDTTTKKDLEHLVNFHEEVGVGDVTSIWAYKRFNHEHISLILHFTSPVDLKITILFNSFEKFTLIDGIRTSKAVYIQPGAPGDKVRNDINAPKILVEIPARTTFEKWDDILEKAILKKFKKEGLRGKPLREAMKDYISVTRDIWGRRLK